MPFSLSFSGDFATLGNFFSRLEHFVTLKGDEIAVSGRLLRVESIALTPGERGWPALTAQIGASSYIVPETAAATATGRRADSHGRRHRRRPRPPTTDHRERRSDEPDHRHLARRSSSASSGRWRCCSSGALVAVPVVLAKDAGRPRRRRATHAAKDEAHAGHVRVRRRRRPRPSAAPPRARRGQGPVRAGRRCQEGQGPRRRPPPKKAAADKTTTGRLRPRRTPSTESGGGAGDAAPVAAEPPARRADADHDRTRSTRSRSASARPTSERPTAKTVERLTVLPDEEEPVLVYRGVEDGGKVAVFELTGVVVAEGDGKCEPDPEDCQYLKLRAGETEFITVSDTGTETDAQYQLDLVKINKKATTEKSDADQGRRRWPRRASCAQAWAASATATSSTRRPARCTSAHELAAKHPAPRSNTSRREPMKRDGGPSGPPSLVAGLIGSPPCHCTSSPPGSHTGRA